MIYYILIKLYKALLLYITQMEINKNSNANDDWLHYNDDVTNTTIKHSNNTIIINNNKHLQNNNIDDIDYIFNKVLDNYEPSIKERIKNISKIQLDNKDNNKDNNKINSKNIKKNHNAKNKQFIKQYNDDYDDYDDYDDTYDYLYK